MQNSHHSPHSDLIRFQMKEAERYYLQASYRIRNSGVAGQPARRIDESGRLCIKAAIRRQEHPDNRAIIELKLHGGNAMRRHAHVWSEEKGAEGIYADGEGRFFSARVGDVPFALADAVHSDDWPDLMAAMLLAPRPQDLELFGERHPAIATEFLTKGMNPKGDFIVIPENSKEAESLSLARDLAQQRFDGRFGWSGAGLFTLARNEPFYTVLAPLDRSMGVRIALDIDECPPGTPFATFPADRRDDAVAFARLLESLGYGPADDERHGYTWIHVDKGQLSSPRNHAWEIEMMADMVRNLLQWRGDDRIDEALYRLQSTPLHQSKPYGRWRHREAWLQLWPEVSAVIGDITPERLASAKDEDQRLGLCVKSALDWLTEAIAKLPEHA